MGIYGTLGHSGTHFRGENSAFLSAVFTAFELGHTVNSGSEMIKALYISKFWI